VKRRPSRESDAMKIVLSDDVAPKFIQYLKHRGDFVSAIIAYSMDYSDESKRWWEDLSEYVTFAEEVRKYFERLYEEGKPIKRSVLLKIREIAMRYDENVRNNKFLVLLNSLAGIKADTLVLPEYAKSVRVYKLSQGKWWQKAFEVPIVD